jgi:hypothetical protein
VPLPKSKTRDDLPTVEDARNQATIVALPVGGTT